MENLRNTAIIINYIESYNNFDIKGMLRDIDQDVVFENITNGKIDLQLKGKAEFEQQAETAMKYFRMRSQKIEAWHFAQHLITVDIQYRAVLALDLLNGLKSGDTLELKGKSDFVIEEGKIKLIRDYSNR